MIQERDLLVDSLFKGGKTCLLCLACFCLIRFLFGEQNKPFDSGTSVLQTFRRLRQMQNINWHPMWWCQVILVFEKMRKKTSEKLIIPLDSYIFWF